MKTSNKILLSLFLLPFIIVVFVYASLYAKYKNNDYVTEEQIQEESHITAKLDPFTQIDMSGYKGGHVTIKYSDNFALSFNKWDKDNFVYEIKNNTLFVKTNNRFHNPVTILCPSFEDLYVDSTGIQVDSIRLKNVHFNIGHNANLSFNGGADTISADIKSAAGMDFNSSATAGVLNLTMEHHSSFENNNGLIKQFGKMLLQDSADVRINGKTLNTFLEKTPGATN